MAEVVNDATGEIIKRGPLPPEIAGAIVNIMKATKQLGFDEKNAHANYNYASIDKFLEAFRPLLAEAGLIIMLDESECEFREGPPSSAGKTSSYAFLGYHVWLIHESGVTWGPLTRRLALPATGPQTFGAAESYVLKRFMRNLFQVPTGEKDADELAAGEIPTRPNGARAYKRETPAPASGDLDEARKRYKELIDAIDTAMALPDIDGWMASPAWKAFEDLSRRTNPDVHEGVMEKLRARAEHRKKLLREQAGLGQDQGDPGSYGPMTAGEMGDD